jgi:hypothetical protein
MVRRLVLALTVVAVVAGASIGTPSLTVSGLQVSHGPELAKAQPGATIYCGDYKTAYYISSGEYWYARVFRWCYTPSIQEGWYIDWVNWYWGSYAQGPGYYLAGPGYAPGYQYTVNSIQQ